MWWSLVLAGRCFIFLSIHDQQSGRTRLLWGNIIVLSQFLNLPGGFTRPILCGDHWCWLALHLCVNSWSTNLKWAHTSTLPIPSGWMVRVGGIGTHQTMVWITVPIRDASDSQPNNKAIIYGKNKASQISHTIYIILYSIVTLYNSTWSSLGHHCTHLVLGGNPNIYVSQKN